MKIDVSFGPVKSFIQEQSVPDKGYIGIGRSNPDEMPTVEWFKCREQFHRKMTESNNSDFYFAHLPDQEKSIACFIAKVEEVIALNFPLEKTNFCQTNKNYALWVDPSSFWKECNVKLSLLTIFLRIGMFYDPSSDNFDEAFIAQNAAYTESSAARNGDTPAAIERFLYGFTKFVPLNEDEAKLDVGWVNLFKNKTIDQIRKQLISPVEKEIYSIGGSALWT